LPHVSTYLPHWALVYCIAFQALQLAATISAVLVVLNSFSTVVIGFALQPLTLQLGRSPRLARLDQPDRALAQCYRSPRQSQAAWMVYFHSTFRRF
jgi:predicted ferric reductase